MKSPAVPLVSRMSALQAAPARRHSRAFSLMAFAAAALVVLLALVGGCSALWLFGSDEEGLLCGPDDGNPRCLDGFVCARGTDDVERCVRAGFKEEGASCSLPAECSSGLTCADAYAALCPAGLDDDMGCGLVDEQDRGLRCRRICNPADRSTCGNNARCFAFEGQEAFCQQGTCATSSDCILGGLIGLCIDAAPNTTGRTGLCLERCDPLACAQAGTCDCVGRDGARDDAFGCVTPPGEAISNRFVCQEVGSVSEGGACDFGGNLCARGLTCAPLVDGSFGCVRWCRVGGGNPGCLEFPNCQAVTNEVGICQ
jgi:hypothetical protein